MSVVRLLSLGFIACFVFHDIAIAAGTSAPSSLTRKQRLGKRLFFDTNLSNPPGQACASCHDSRHFFTDPDSDSPTSAGVNTALKGSRNAPSLFYAAFSPRFHFDTQEGLYLGGQFLDGRARTLAEQAKGPLLNPIEMANPDKAAVVEKVRQADYAPLFERVYGTRVFANTDRAFNRIADAISAFERTPSFAPFTSKYDYYLAGKARLTDQERRGRKLFEDPEKGNCAACHPSRPVADGTPPLFTDFSYDNLGVPSNPANPFFDLEATFNPDGQQFTDTGLGKSVGDAAENGKFKVPTLRNIAKTGPYMHNGYFRSLRVVVDFYNSRDIKPACAAERLSETVAVQQSCWPAPEVSENVNRDELGDLGLTGQQIDDIVAFLQTLTDGYQP